jgi:hypothetical protein
MINWNNIIICFVGLSLLIFKSAYSAYIGLNILYAVFMAVLIWKKRKYLTLQKDDNALIVWSAYNALFVWCLCVFQFENTNLMDVLFVLFTLFCLWHYKLYLKKDCEQ